MSSYPYPTFGYFLAISIYVNVKVEEAGYYIVPVLDTCSCNQIKAT